jgi:hypothetical protein
MAEKALVMTFINHAAPQSFSLWRLKSARSGLIESSMTSRSEGAERKNEEERERGPSLFV